MDNYSLSDLAAVVDNRDRDNCNDNMFGGSGGILALIIIFVLLFAVGGGGWGNRGNDGVATLQGQYATQADLQRGFDTSTIVNKLDGISNGICDSTFALNNAINNGFANSNLTNVQGFNSVNSAICNLGYQQQQCCCETNRNIDALRYEAAKNTCDIITAGHNDTQRIIDTITSNTIQELRDNLQAAQLQLGNLSQTSTIINAVRPFPTPAYITCSPYQAAHYGGYGGNCGGYNNCGNCNYMNV